MDMNDLPKEVRDALRMMQEAGADVHVVKLEEPEVDYTKGVTKEERMETLFQVLDFFVGGEVKQLLRGSSRKPEEVWEYLSKNGYTEETLSVMTAAALWGRVFAEAVEGGFPVALRVLIPTYSAAGRVGTSISDLISSITKNRNAMLKLLVDGGFYELA